MTTVSAPHQRQGWTADDSTFGARLALIRQRMGWGNVKEASACGLPVESWRNWERDNVEPRRMVTIVKMIAGATGCDWLWLLDGPGEGGDIPTHEYARSGHVVATVGDAERTSRSIPRPVRRTRPIVAGSARPLTPVAV